jgi:hypothetical protein
MDHLGDERREPVDPAVRESNFENDVFAFDPPAFAQPLPERGELALPEFGAVLREISYSRHFSGLLRLDVKRQEEQHGYCADNSAPFYH